MECIVLAGGLGTRLRNTIGDLPKCMAPVNGKPFLHYMFLYLAQQGCTKVILSLGYRADVVIDWLAGQDLPFVVSYVLEYEPLGTGGGLQLAIATAAKAEVAVLNGDTMFPVSLKGLFAFHNAKGAITSLALKEMYNFDRFGVVRTDDQGVITAFEEKKHQEHGFINGGVYIIDRASFMARHLPEKFSFEKDYLEAFAGEHQFYGLPCNDHFIDIGIPADHQQAQHDLKSLFA